MLSACLDATSRDKVQFLGAEYKQVLAELIGKERLESRFGGDMPNLTEKFFPPDLDVEGEQMYTSEEAAAK